MKLENIGYICENLISQGEVLVEFKAGKLNQVGTTVTAENRRGTLKMMRTGDGLTRLQWITRPGDKKEDDVVVIPSDCTVEKVNFSD